MTLDEIKSQIDLDSPDEHMVMKAVFFEAGNSLKGFLDVFTEEEVVKMWQSDNIWSWTQSNRDWLTSTVDSIIFP